MVAAMFAFFKKDLFSLLNCVALDTSGWREEGREGDRERERKSYEN